MNMSITLSKYILSIYIKNFCSFEHENELIHVKIYLTSFIEFMILNQIKKELLGAKLKVDKGR